MSFAIVPRRLARPYSNHRGNPDSRGRVPGRLQRLSALACNNAASPTDDGVD